MVCFSQIISNPQHCSYRGSVVLWAANYSCEIKKEKPENVVGSNLYVTYGFRQHSSWNGLHSICDSSLPSPGGLVSSSPLVEYAKCPPIKKYRGFSPVSLVLIRFSSHV
jgi:hypothetical protein